MESEAPSGRAPSARPWLVACSLWLGFAAVAALALWHLRHEAIGGQVRELHLLSLASSDAIDRGLRGAEEGLHAMRAELEEGRLPLDAGEAALALKTRTGLMPLVDALWVLDAAGQVIARSDAASVPDSADFLPPLSALQADDLSMSRAFAHAQGRGESVAIAIRYAGPHQTAGGWIVAALPVGALLGALGDALPAADARLWVFRRDGTRLATVNAGPAGPAPPAPITQDQTAPDRTAPWSRLPALVVRTFAVGSSQLVDRQTVPRYGIQLLVSRDLTAVLAPWRHAAEGAVVALLVLGGVMAAAVYLVQLADRRREQAQRALQAQIARAGKLESLGTLAGGVAHDFNNVLAGIVGFAEMAQDEAAPGSAQARHLDQVLRTAMRGKTLVDRILAFSRGGARTSTLFALEPVVQEVLALLSAALPEGIVVEPLFEAPAARLSGDTTQAFEAVMNLCTNAIQAMPQGGTLGVHLAREQVSEPRVLSHTQLAAGRYVTLAVSDEGVGIAPTVMERLFEPFFTTRAALSGTGLGLAVVFGVVSEFGGAIDVRSRPGQGARFTLYFPEHQDGIDADLPPACTASQPSRDWPKRPPGAHMASAMQRLAGRHRPVRRPTEDGHDHPDTIPTAPTKAPQCHAHTIPSSDAREPLSLVWR